MKSFETTKEKNKMKESVIWMIIWILTCAVIITHERCTRDYGTREVPQVQTRNCCPDLSLFQSDTIDGLEGVEPVEVPQDLQRVINNSK
jgi:hypothetical protein